MIVLWLRRLFLAAIVGASLYASIRNLMATRELGGLGEDPVADWEIRFAPVKKELPFVRGVVGYISDSDVPGASFDPANEEGEYILTQYSMAPIILVRGTDQQWNLANLSTEAFSLWAAKNSEPFDVIPFKGGLYLLRRSQD